MSGHAANFHPTFRSRLVKWYLANRRQMPWRAVNGDAANPYHVFLSEAMLQQTQVATVVPYFLRFIEAFPTVESLAAADEQAVLRLWQGLGYYRRARNLHAAAKAIVAEHGGRVPDTLDDLLTLPGVGRYTAGAVASIAFDVRAPILDGNVARVLARVFAVEEPIDQPATREWLWAQAEQLVPVKGAGDFNQAMMELGATICTPRSPQCLVCPLRKLCQAQLRSLQDQLPRTAGRRKPTAATHDIVAVRRGQRYLFEQRPDRGLWSNMWQLPTRESPDGDPGSWLNDRFDLHTKQLDRLGAFTHQLTHRTITFTLWHTQLTKKGSDPIYHPTATTKGSDPFSLTTGQWRSLDHLDDLPLANPQRKAIAMLRER